jgi:hypothetical protein
LNLIQAKRNYKQSQREVKYWKTEYQQSTSKLKHHQQMETLIQRQVKERTILGGRTYQELMNEIDQRTPELTQLVASYDRELYDQQQSVVRQQALVLQHKKKVALERKMEMIEALDKFPKAYNDAITALNAVLCARSPKDPPPPRRSKRSRDDTDDGNQQHDDEATTTVSSSQRRNSSSTSYTPKVKRTKTTSATNVKASAQPSSPNDMAVETAWSNMAATLMHHSSSTDDVVGVAAINNSSRDIAKSTAVDNTTINHTKKQQYHKKYRDARNVGGWISPQFSQELDRSWLTRGRPLKPAIVVPTTGTTGGIGKSDNVMMFDLKGWVPQVGEIVLYYPSAHKVRVYVWQSKM